MHPGVGFELTDVPTLHEILVGGATPVLQLDVEQHEYAIAVLNIKKLVGQVDDAAHE